MTIKKSGKLSKRISALTMAALIVMEQFAYIPQMTASAERSASDSGAVNFPAVYSADDVSAILSHNDQLVDNGDGTYTFTSELMSSYSYYDESRGRLYSQDGSYVLDKAGVYLIELWGGDGGDGSSFFPLSFKAGAGGKGGFVYGLLEVSEEQAEKKNKLYYEIGSRGLSETRSVTGGGTGGIGGGAGDIAVFSVGAGGGYSAVYLMGKDDEINDTIRNDPSKVLMIAGGGGGGGAGAALHTLPGLFGGEGKANGGEGGTFESSTKGTPNIGNFVKSNESHGSYVGTYYAGVNGSTSGTKGAYVGKGGTDIPGEIVSSFIGFLEASSYPNDWQLTYHPELERGVGGASNFRGGGGGAGFAGGSGGMQNEPLDARNVGGGGGGSSYVGDFKNFTPGAIGDANYFVERDGNTNAETGGAVVIRYLSKSDEGTDYSYLSNITVSGEVSQYFDVVSDNCTINGNKFTATGSVEPVTSGLAKGQEKDKLTLSIKLKPKAGFFGGNNVPIFNELDEDGTTLNVASGTKTTSIKLKDDVKHVNVPYNISIKTKNSTVHKDDDINKETLYADGYTEIAYNANDPMQAFISGITYEISGLGTDGYTASSNLSYTITENDVNKTLSSDIKVTLEERAGITPAKVGSTGTNVFHKKAALRCVDSGQYTVDGYGFNADKKLTYDENTDTYDLTTKIEMPEQELNGSFTIFDAVDSKEFDFDISTDSGWDLTPGYYYLQIWGGDGSNGYNSNNKTGGTRGQGGYIGKYLYITKFISIYVKQANAPSASTDSSHNGKGGDFTAVSLDKEHTDMIMVAGGGGGGGAVYGVTTTGWFGIPTTTYYNGVAGYNAEGNIDNVGIRSDGNYSGENGSLEDDTRALAGQNYIADNTELDGIMFIDEGDIPDFIDVSKSPLEGNSFVKLANPLGRGAVRITKLGIKQGYKIDDETGLLETDSAVIQKIAELQGSLVNSDNAFTLSETFSPYFDVYDNGGGTVNDNTVSFEVDMDLIESTESVTDFKPYDDLSYKTTGTTYSYNITSNTEKTVKLKSITGFLGGNDVPLLESAEISHSGNTASTNDDNRAIPPLDYTDYANVALASETLDDTISTTPVFVDYNTTLTADKLSENISTYPNNEDKGLIDDYAEYSEVAYDDKVGQIITKDTDCFVIAELKAKTGASRANVIGAVDKVNRNFKVPVYVSYPIETQLTNLTSNAAAKFPKTVNDTELVFEITANNGYDLPVEQDVLITNTDLTVQNAEPTAIENAVVEKIDDKIRVSIPRKSITGKVTVTALGVFVKHNVKYYYEMYDPISRMINLEEAVDSKTFANGDVINGLTYPKVPDKYPVGYDGYFWDWSIETDENGDHIMGQEDVIIVGTYKPITYILKVNYYTKESKDAYPVYNSTYTTPYDRTKYENGTYHIALTKDAEFFVASPNIDGYVADRPYVSGKVDDAFINSLHDTVTCDDGKERLMTEVNVYYTKVPEGTNLIVNFVACDVRGAPLGTVSGITAITEGYDETYDYSNIKDVINSRITSANEVVKITRLTSDADIGTTESQVDAIASAGTYNVYFREKPNKVTIELYKEIGDTEPVETRTAVIGREYSYDAEKDDYRPLPSVVRDTDAHNYRHTGWQNDSDDIVEDDMIVSGTAGETIKLYAVWESSDITIKVKHMYAMNISDEEKRGEEAADQVVKTITYGKSYTFNSAEIPHYNADPMQITGVALSNKTETFYYIDGENPDVSITIKANIYSTYYKDDSGNAVEGAPLLKGGTFSLYDRNGTLIGTKQNTDGIVSWDNIEFDIKQGMTYTIKCTTSPTGYGTGEATVTVGTSDTDIVIDDIEIFLDASPFELPYAGSTPMTGYTVFGTSTMVLAVFLLFVHMRSKTEEEKNKKTN